MNKIFVLTYIFASSYLFSQVQIGIESTNQYYIDDDVVKLDEDEAEERFRSNTYLKLDYNIGDFDFITQLESYLPKALMNFNPLLKEVNFGFVQAKYTNFDKGIDISVGHLYEQFGSGLALRFWENRANGFNNALLGARVNYNINELIEFKFLAGKQRIGMGFDLSAGFIYATDVGADISSLLNSEDDFLKISGSFVAKQEDTHDNYINLPVVYVFGPRTTYSNKNFSIGSEFLFKTKDVHFQQNDFDLNDLNTGSALLINTSYTKGAFGLNVNLRRLENFSWYSQRDLQGDDRFLNGNINFIPTLTKQNKYSLQNINVYLPQFNLFKSNDALSTDKKISQPSKLGDIGGQFDIIYDVRSCSFLGGKTGLSITSNGSIWSGLSMEITHDDEYVSEIKGKNFLSIGEKYYSDFGIGLRKNIAKEWTTAFSYLQQHINLPVVAEKTGEGFMDTHSIAFENIYYFSSSKSLKMEFQHQSADKFLGNWVAGLLEYTPNSKFSLFVQDSYNYGNKVVEEQIHYYTIGSALNFKSTRMSLGYGRQRGGLTCFGGSCYIIPERNGLNFSISTTF